MNFFIIFNKHEIFLPFYMETHIIASFYIVMINIVHEISAVFLFFSKWPEIYSRSLQTNYQPTLQFEFYLEFNWGRSFYNMSWEEVSLDRLTRLLCTPYKLLTYSIVLSHICANSIYGTLRSCISIPKNNNNFKELPFHSFTCSTVNFFVHPSTKQSLGKT